MKATDLMISDYLSYKGQIIKIVSITKKKVGYHTKANECRMHYARLCDCKPIPIILEILENIGFEKALQVSDVEPFDTDEDGNKHYSYNRIFWGWYQPDNIFCIPASGMGWLHIKYVHQLQHALKLSGIEKVIKLEDRICK
jgi:hypothetical protein